MIYPIQPERDANGYWTHPDLPEIEMTDSDFIGFCFNIGFLVEIQKMCEFNYGIEQSQASQENIVDCSEWHPIGPPSSFLISIQNASCGPIAVFAIPKEVSPLTR